MIYNAISNKLPSIRDICIKGLVNPLFVYRPHSLVKAVRHFQRHFAAKILYAVKTNPEPEILQHLMKHGIKAFDVASVKEIKTILEINPHAEVFYMHPVKARPAIKEAYFEYGVRHFSLDTEEELCKILQETNYAKDLQLHMRLAIPNSYAELSLADKFGINVQQAPALLKKIRQYAQQIGVCFHVGSQCMHPDAYRIAIKIAGETIGKAKVKIDYFNVGGGFPSAYPGMHPPPLEEYFDAIQTEFENLPNFQCLQLLAEPGRAIVAESGSLIVRVDLRKQDKLYINDGTYGGLFDAGHLRFIFPTRLVETNHPAAKTLLPFCFYGPTCDSLDYMKGPFYLPENIAEGDYIEIGQMGAYGKTLATTFNGFGHTDEMMHVSDKPLLTMYDLAHSLAA